jgi:ribonuclease BN (tRNA processing enzyme)
MNFKLSDVFAPGEITKYPTFFGPEEISNFLKDYSNLVELPAYEGYDKIKVLEYKPEMKIDDFVLKPFKVSHNAFNIQARSYALRFEIGNKVITFSGDSTKCKGLEDTSKNADLFVCDSSYPKGQSSVVHLDTSEIGEIANTSHVKKLLLDHFYPRFAKYDLVKEVREIFKGEIIKAKDLDVIEI